MNVLIRPESDQDYEIIHAIETSAFGREDEALLVKKLRENKVITPLMSLLAWWKDYPVGHLLFCPLQIRNAEKQIKGVSLGPVAVLPEFQRRGFATTLIRKGIAVMTQQGFEVLTVLGDRKFYERFGFSQRLGEQFDSLYAGEHFMALELKEKVLNSAEKWKVIYPKEFEEITLTKKK